MGIGSGERGEEPAVVRRAPSILLLPLLGAFAACGLFAALKLTAVAALLLARPRRAS